MESQRNISKQAFRGGLLLLLVLSGSAWAQSLPRDEQQFCNAFPTLRQELMQAHVNFARGSLNQQRRWRQAASVAAKDFKKVAGWRSSSQSVKGWLGELHSITETTAWGHYLGISVKLPCGDVIVGVPEMAVRRWSSSGMDPIAASCAQADPYIASNTSVFADLRRLSTGQTVTFSGQFCAIPDSTNDNAIYFVFSRIAPTR